MRSEKRRLDYLWAVVRPAKSLAARLANLTDEQRAAYDAWVAGQERWRESEPHLNAYERTLNGDVGPQLYCDVQDALFGSAPTIPIDATAADAAEIYRRYAFGD